MTYRSGAGRLTLRAGLAGSLAFFLAACMADGGNGIDTTGMGDVQPRRATYNCGEDGRITVENNRTMVRLVEADGESYELAASPPAQTSRYGEDGLALVLDGREALWMKARHEPMTCRR